MSKIIVETKAPRRWHWRGCSSVCGLVAGGAAAGKKYRRDKRMTTMASAGTDVGEKSSQCGPVAGGAGVDVVCSWMWAFVLA